MISAISGGRYINIPSTIKGSQMEMDKDLDIKKTFSKEELEEIRRVNEKLKNLHQESKNSLEEADFVKILVTQLKNQDPTKPVEDKEFIAQMAQLTQIKQLNKIETTLKDLTIAFSTNTAYGLIGKEIKWLDNVTGEERSGKVEGIRISDNGVFARVNDTSLVDIKHIVEIK